MAQFVLKIENIFPYHGANPNTRNGARLRFPSMIMAPGYSLLLHTEQIWEKWVKKIMDLHFKYG